jgi:beta-glucosidase
MKYISFLVITCLTSYVGLSQSVNAKALVAKMSLEEKVNIVVGMGMNIPGMANAGPVVGQTMDKVAGAAGTTYAIPRLGLPNTVLADGPAGIRIDSTRKNDPNKYYATAWPVATLLASTWNSALVESVGRAMGNEVKEYGVDILLAPALNTHRNTLGGRNFEYYSEDPLVSGKMAAAMVNGIESNGVGTSVKHFAANNQETNRNSVNTIVSERALREIYLKGFQIVVKEAQPWTVMSSYNLINGKYTSEDYDLLTTILRKEWGFKGLVMTDWFGGKNAVAQMKAGNDLLMPGTPLQKKFILEAVKKGELNEAILDENAGRIVDYILGTPASKNYAFTNKPNLKAHAILARNAAAEGMVLLQNNNKALPVSNKSTLAVFGNTSYAFIAGGTGSGDVNEAYTVSLDQGLINAGYTLDDACKKAYTTYLNDYNTAHPKKNFFAEIMNPTPSAPEFDQYDSFLEGTTTTCEAAVITIGRNAGEFRDRKIEADFNLTEKEHDLIDRVANAFHKKGKKVIVVINAGGFIEMASWKDKVDAVLLAWQGGQEGGNAVADILSGKINPSGKLATTAPVKYQDEPSSKNFPGKEFIEKATMNGMGMKEIPAEVVYEEGIYVGYRYYSTYRVKPVFEFGYGLSYTAFSYSNVKLNNTVFKDKLVISATITNTGKVPGKEIAQLYITAPGKTINKPVIELKAFAKTKLLAPGESETVVFTLQPSDLASYHPDRTAWIVEPGVYEIKLGKSSANIVGKTSFNVQKELITERCNKVMLPQVPIKELHP